MERTVDCPERLITDAIQCAYNVHRQIGPGLLESVYQVCLAYELTKAGICFQREVALPVVYDGDVQLETGYRLDFLIENVLIIETKTVEELAPVHLAQVLTYLRLAKLRRGLLINFYVPRIKEGIKRVVNGW